VRLTNCGCLLYFSHFVVKLNKVIYNFITSMIKNANVIPNLNLVLILFHFWFSDDARLTNCGNFLYFSHCVYIKLNKMISSNAS